MKLALILTSLLLGTSAMAASLTLSGGDSVVIEANSQTRVTCQTQGRGDRGGPRSDDSYCNQENSRLQSQVSQLQLQVSQLQNDLYRCQSAPVQKIWNCTYTCSGNNGMGSNTDKSLACQAAKRDSGVMCSAQCVCVQE